MSYEKIIDLPRHTSRTRRKMPLVDRAAQFAPFAALSGFEGEIAEEGRVTEDGIILDESQIERLDLALREIKESLGRCRVRLLLFVKDERKRGGEYREMTGAVTHIDELEGHLTLDGNKISFIDLIDIEVLKNES